MTDWLIRMTTALAVVAVAVVAAVISYQHAYELVRSHGESGVTARLLPFTVDGLIWAASMVVLDASRRGQPVVARGRVTPNPNRGTSYLRRRETRRAVRRLVRRATLRAPNITYLLKVSWQAVMSWRQLTSPWHGDPSPHRLTSARCRPDREG